MEINLLLLLLPTLHPKNYNNDGDGDGDGDGDDDEMVMVMMMVMVMVMVMMMMMMWLWKELPVSRAQLPGWIVWLQEICTKSAL